MEKRVSSYGSRSYGAGGHPGDCKIAVAMAVRLTIYSAARFGGVFAQIRRWVREPSEFSRVHFMHPTLDEEIRAA